jgi:transposase
MATQNYPVLGIDVSKAKLDCCLLSENQSHHYATVPNTAKGLVAIVHWLDKQQIVLAAVCMEATNSYSAAATLFFYERSVPTYLANPGSVKRFRELENHQTKTDKADAALLADYGVTRAHKLRPWKPLSAEYQQLRDLVRRLGQLTRCGARAKTQMEKADYLSSAAKATVIRSLKADIRHYERQIALIHKEIKVCLRAHTHLQKRYELLMTAPGIGPISTLTFMTEVPDISRFNSAKQVVAFAGVCPKIKHSGTKNPVSAPITKAGSGRLRGALYMASLSAKHRNNSVSGFAERLQSKNPPKKVIIAVERKIIHLLFAMEKNKQPFDPNYQKQTVVAIGN